MMFTILFESKFPSRREFKLIFYKEKGCWITICDGKHVNMKEEVFKFKYPKNKEVLSRLLNYAYVTGNLAEYAEFRKWFINELAAELL